MIHEGVSTAELLCFALTMLEEAREEQAKSSRKDKWLSYNVTLEMIRKHVAALKEANQC